MNFFFLFFVSFACFFVLLAQSEVVLSNSLTFIPGETNVMGTFLDEDEGFIYFLDERNYKYSYIWKYDLNTLEFLNYTHIEEDYVNCGAIDFKNKFLYLATSNSHKFLKFNLTSFQVVDNATLNVSSGSQAIRVEIDIINQKAYVGFTAPITIVKFDLVKWGESSSLPLSGDRLSGSIIDIDNGILYVAIDSYSGNNATIYKIDLSTFTLVDSLKVNLPGAKFLNFGVIDSPTQMMYFGIDQTPMRIAKIDIKNFTSVGVLNLLSQSYCYGAGIDTFNRIGYFLAGNGYLMKLNLTDFSLIDSLHFSNYWVGAMAIDFSAKNAYIESGNSQFVRVNLTSLTEVNKTGLIVYTDPVFILIDEQNQTAYVCFNDHGGLIAKVDLQSFSLIDYLILGLSDDIYQGEIDTKNGFIYLFFFDNLTISKVLLSNFSLSETVSLDSGSYTILTSFDQENQILYLLYANSSNYYYLLKISCPDLEITDSLPLQENIFAYGLYPDPWHGFIYCWIIEYYGPGSGYFLYKVQLSTFSKVGQVNLTEYGVAHPVFDKTHQLIYFGDFSESIYRVDLINMDVMNGYLDIRWADFVSSFIESTDSWVFFVVNYYNSASGDFDIPVILQIDSSSNQLISNTTFDLVSSSIIDMYDPTTNYAYAIIPNSVPFILYQLSFPTPPPTPTPSPSSSQQILFSFLIFGIMMILGLF